MSDTVDLSPAGLPALYQALLAKATRHTTFYEGQTVVWHHWGQRRPGRLPLVMLHGGSGSWTHWIRNIDALLAQGFELWLPDLPGFGDSDPPATGADADAMLAPLRAGMVQLGLLPCQLMGFSFGGMTAAMLTAAYPDAVERLVLVGAPAMGVVPEKQFSLKGWRHLSDPAEQLEMHRYNLGALMLWDAAKIDDQALALHQHNVLRDRLPRRRLANTDILAQSLPQIACPVAAIYGAYDALYKSYMPALEHKYRAVTPQLQAFVRVPDSGHWVQYEQPDAFLATLLPLLAS
ncbi:pimeloyl-ACP methyl ester carboxylesterase [Comamonas sp. BIGb0152]|uniref:alpha/beta fold hydrolase n=1 Tax=Comamonas sp. BIGb0152 TaxID=2940601 RepID=UPI002169E3AD|nr:alpha/beta hydrolase [Comamonas sp. BIGb0152]MCS4293324.1 pimeloyl-ACP methyl ester carboxylesterase [Comamonas sp. BIGb0152]